MRNKTKIFWFLSFAALAVLLTGAGCINLGKKEAVETKTTEPEEKTTVTVDKTSYETGEDVVVTYDIVEDLGEKAWMGIVPSATVHDSEEEADAVDTDFEYLDGSKAGTKTLTAPSEAGSYDVRIYSSDQTVAKELSYVSFTVVASTAAGSVLIDIDKQEYAPGATITVTFSGVGKLGSTAWVGVISSDVEHGSEATNDENDTSYAYLGGKESGTVTLTAPTEPGSYDVRLNESDTTENAKELKYVSFEVK